MDLLHARWERKFSVSLYKCLKLKLSEMTFSKDFINDLRGDLYPLLEKSQDCTECVANNRYLVGGGTVKRLMGHFFPYATYEMTASPVDGTVGFCFALPDAQASIAFSKQTVMYSCGETTREVCLPEHLGEEMTMVVSCRPGAFDVYFSRNDKADYLCTFAEETFSQSHRQSVFAAAQVAISVSGEARICKVLSYIDNGVSIADPRPIRYENGEIMSEQGKIYLTASIRMQAGSFQGVFSWIPGTAELALSGALFYDCGDGMWCGDVAASVLYHRAEKRWLLWVCSFSHGHILGHASFEGDPRFGVNVVDITLMSRAPEGEDISSFAAFTGDEDPDFFYDESKGCWLMAICRLDPKTKRYRYVFFASADPFSEYRFIGMGFDGAETGGSFVKVQGEVFFLCGNDFHKTSDYRIYHKGGFVTASFRYPDGGFRGWGTMIPIRLGSRTRYFWITFDRHLGSDYNWSYGNLYCFEAW